MHLGSALWQKTALMPWPSSSLHHRRCCRMGMLAAIGTKTMAIALLMEMATGMAMGIEKATTKAMAIVLARAMVMANAMVTVMAMAVAMLTVMTLSCPWK